MTSRHAKEKKTLYRLVSFEKKMRLSDKGNFRNPFLSLLRE